jgi:uncharacterized linocin/CFP29 family protein
MTTLQRYGEHIREEIITALQPKFIGRQVARDAPDVKGEGILSVKTVSMSEMGPAEISFSLPRTDANRDIIKVTEGSENLLVIHKSYEIPRMDYLVWQAKGKSLDQASSLAAGRTIVAREDTFIFQGATVAGQVIPGLYTGAANNVPAALDFGVFGNATIAVSSAIEALVDDNVNADAFNLILHPTQYAELFRSRHGATGLMELPDIMRQLNGGKDSGAGQILQTKALTAGTGLVLPVDNSREYFELYAPLDLQVIVGEDSKMPQWGPLYGTQLEFVLPHYKHPNAGCQLLAI